MQSLAFSQAGGFFVGPAAEKMQVQVFSSFLMIDKPEM